MEDLTPLDRERRKKLWPMVEEARAAGKAMSVHAPSLMVLRSVCLRLLKKKKKKKTQTFFYDHNSL